MTRRALLIPLSLLLILALIWSAWWFYTARFAQRAFEDWIGAQRAEGYQVSYGAPSFSGFPARIVMTVPSIAVAAPAGLWSVNGDGLAASFLPWDFSTYDLSSIGHLRLRTPTLPLSMDEPIVAKDLEGQYRRRPEQGHHDADLILRGVSGPLGFAADEIALRGFRPFRRAVSSDALAASLRFEAVGITLPGGVMPPTLSQTVEAALLSLDVFGPEPSGSASLAKQLVDWRDAGGLIKIPELALIWEDLNLQGDGTASVDEYTRPEVSLAIRVAGLSETARRFEQAGMIKRSVRQAIELGTSLLSFGTGGDGRIKVPVSVRQGQLFLGPALLGEVAPLLPGRTPPKRLVPVQRVEPALGEPALPPPPPTVSPETLNAQ